MDEYLPPVVTKLKADLSDFLAGIAEARAVMKAFAQGVRDDMLDASRSAGALSGMVMVTEMRTVIKQQTETLGEEMAENFQEKIIPKMAKGGADAGMGFMQAFTKIGMPLLIFAIVAATPGIAAAIAGIIQLGFGLGFIGLGAFMLRNEPVLIAAANKLKERITKVFSTASAPMLGPLVKALDIIAASFERLGPSISRGFAALAPAIVPLAEGLAGMMEAMAPGLTAMVVAAGPIIMEFAKQLPGIGVSLGEFFQMIADNAPTISAFISDMGRVIPAIVRGLSGMLNFLMGIYQHVHNIHAAMRGAGWETPFHGFVTSGKAAWSWISETGPKIGKWFVDLGGTISDWASDASDDIGEFVDDVGVWFGELPGKAGAALAALPGVVGRAISTAFDAAIYYATFGAIRLIQSQLNLPGQLMNIYTGAWRMVGSLTRQGVETVTNIVTELATRMGTLFARIWVEGTAFLRNLATDAGKFAGTAVNNILSWFAQLPERALAHFIATKNRIVGFVSSAGTWLYELGKDVIRGFVRGVENSVDSAVDAIRRAMDRIRRAAREALNSNSPSKVFMDIGVDTVKGYVLGIESERAALARSMRIFGAGVPSGTAAMNLGAAAAGVSRGGDGGSAGDRPILVQLLLDGKVLVEQLVEPAQQRKMRTGQSGLA